MARMLRAAGFVFFSGMAIGGGSYPPVPHTKLPFRFEDHGGQIVARGPGYVLTIRATGNVLAWSDRNRKGALDTTFTGANAGAAVVPEVKMASVSNYFLGNSPREWKTGVANYEQVRIRDIYPGVDLVFHGNEGSLEYDFVVQPGARARGIGFETRGARRISLTPEGDLVLSTPAGEVRWRKPVIYQERGTVRRQIAGGFRLKAKRVGFWTGEYDHSRPLVIDPVLAYATYFGAQYSGAGGFESAQGVGTDGAGNVYIAGITDSYDLPVTPGVIQSAFGGVFANIRYFEGDVFVAKFTPAGAISYVTYLGGSGDDAASAIAVDSAGNAYVTGATNSNNFPVTTGVVQPHLKGYGGNSCVIFGDAFVSKLNPTGTQLLYSTYLGGSADDFANAIAIDSQGDAYIAGATLSTNFPVVNPVQSSLRGSGGEPGRPSCSGAPLFDGGDAFVAELNPTATTLMFSTYLGGSLDDVATAIALDPSGNIYVGGFTLSTDFPVTSGAYQTKWGGIDPQDEFFNFGDGFVARLNAGGGSLAYATYLGGSGDDAVLAMTADKAGTVYVTGSTSSQNFPTTSTAVQSHYGGYVVLPEFIEQNLGDAFATRLDSKGATLLYSTYLGGSENDAGRAIAVDPSGLIYVSGLTDSTDFPVSSNAMQAVFGGDDTSIRQNYLPYGDGFLTIIDSNLTKPVYSTYYGGEYNDMFTSLAFDQNGNVWMAGNTQSPNLTVTSNAAQHSYTGGPAASGSPSPGTPIVMQSMLAEVSIAATSGGPTLNSLTNAASNKVGAVSPGMVFVVYGNNLGPATLVNGGVDPASGLLASARGGTAVLFDNIPAPLLFVEGTAVSGIAPYEIAGLTTVQVVVEVEGQRSAAMTLPVQATSPGVFSLNYSGTGEVVAEQYVNGQGSLNSAGNPASVGMLVSIYVTGEGQTVPAGEDGLFSTTVVPKPVASVSVSVGGVPQTNINYAGEIPGDPGGIMQVNFFVAAGTPSGSQPVMVTVGGVTSQSGLNLYVQ